MMRLPPLNVESVLDAIEGDRSPRQTMIVSTDTDPPRKILLSGVTIYRSDCTIGIGYQQWVWWDVHIFAPPSKTPEAP